ncbi:unnamed protein product, partial [Callosobruchus maculatus]
MVHVFMWSFDDSCFRTFSGRCRKSNYFYYIFLLKNAEQSSSSPTF